MDYIARIRKNKRRYLGFVKATTKYQKRKEYTIFDFLFFQKKVKKKRKLNEFCKKDIYDYLKTKKYLSESTLREKEKILKAFYRRNFLNLIG